jgi:hypothetical protein
MAHDWVFDVLDDLKTYARANGLPALAAKAEEARHIAAIEIAALQTAVARDPGQNDPGTI